MEIEPEICQDVLNQVVMMGIPELAAKHSILKTGGSSAEMAVSWYFDNMGDPSLEQPLPKQKIQKEGGSASSGVQASDENIMTIASMGFQEDQARKALGKCDNNVERAMDWLFSGAADNEEMIDAGPDEGQVKIDDRPGIYKLHGKIFNDNFQGFVTHLGPSVHCGHYVCHIRKGDDWVLYNDHKVATTSDPPFGKAYMYFFVKE